MRFKLGDSCITQLIFITYEIYKLFDLDYQVQEVFLEMSKAFDKVYHKGLLFKLKQSLYQVINVFLKDRKQRVVLNSQNSICANTEAGVSQGSKLGPLLFFIYINN